MAAATYTPAVTQCFLVLLPEAVIPCEHCSCICHQVLRCLACFESFIIWFVVGRRWTCQWVVDLAAIYSQRQVIIFHCEDRWLTRANDMATSMTDSGTGPCKWVVVIVYFSTAMQSVSTMCVS